MGDQVRLQTVPIRLGLNEQYFIGGMLMLRERLPCAQWDIFASTADAICDCVLDQLPTDHPGSAVWDNRRKRPSGR
jgi:hypothetical protein